MNRPAWKYTWLTYRRDQLWFPGAFWALFVFFTWVLPHSATRFSVARAYLGFMVPLIGGVLAAYSVLDDPAIELRFATPVRPATLLCQRLALILAVQAGCAVAFQLFVRILGVRLTPLGGLGDVQLVWLLPTVALVALGCGGSLVAAQTSVGAFLAGMAWILSLMMKGWFAGNAKPAFLFLAVFYPDDPALAANRCVLVAVSAVLLTLDWRLLHDQERFL